LNIRENSIKSSLRQKIPKERALYKSETFVSIIEKNHYQ
jgi:hypothetical protein